MKKMFILLAVCLFFSPVVFAQDKPLHDNDIMGVSLNMTEDEAANYIKTKLGGKLVAEYTVNVGNDDYMMKNIHLGGEYQLSDTKDASTNNYRDTIYILVDPLNKNKILSIKRWKEYSPSEQILKQVFRDAIIKKYGQPKSEGNSAFTTWSDANLPNPQHFTKGAEYDSCTSTANILFYDQYSFINILQLFNQKYSEKFLPCKTTMTLRSETRNNGEYLSSFQQQLVNVPTALDAIMQFNKVIFTNIEKSKNERIANDSQAKPTL
jgi:hypothetical protein